MPHKATTDADNPHLAVKLPINGHNEADSAATEDSSLNPVANGSSMNDPILGVSGRIHETQPPVFTNGFQRVIPPWLDDFEFLYNTVDLLLPENIELLNEEDGRPLRARLTMREACTFYDVSFAKTVLRLCNLETLTQFTVDGGVLNCPEPEKAKLELGNRVYVGSTVLLLRVLEEAAADPGVQQ